MQGHSDGTASYVSNKFICWRNTRFSTFYLKHLYYCFLCMHVRIDYDFLPLQQTHFFLGNIHVSKMSGNNLLFLQGRHFMKIYHLLRSYFQLASDLKDRDLHLK